MTLSDNIKKVPTVVGATTGKARYQGKYHSSLDTNIIPYNEKKYKGDKKKIALSHKMLR